jgi:hypothetical protein
MRRVPPLVCPQGAPVPVSSTPRKPLIPRSTDALAIDPGYGVKSGGCAVACGWGGTLVGVAFQPGLPVDTVMRQVHHVIVEQPQQDGRSDGVPPATLIKLAWAGARLAGFYVGMWPAACLHEPTPREWKGSEAKPAMHMRMWEALTFSEREVLGGARTAKAIDDACERGALCRWSKPGAALYPSTFKTHNLLDAAAILMWAYGRLERIA